MTQTESISELFGSWNYTAKNFALFNLMYTVGVATSDKKVKVYDVRMLKLQQLYTAHQGPVSQVINSVMGPAPIMDP